MFQEFLHLQHRDMRLSQPQHAERRLLVMPGHAAARWLSKGEVESSQTALEYVMLHHGMTTLRSACKRVTLLFMHSSPRHKAHN